MQLGGYMLRTIFEAITSALKYTYKPPRTYKYGFWELRRLIDEWNANMDKNFTPAWVSCLYNSISKWLNKYMCPGSMCVPRKPWPFGKEYHAIAWDFVRVLYKMDIVKVRDMLSQRPPKEFSDLGGGCWSTLMIDKTIVEHFQVCYPWQWDLRIERNIRVAEEGSVCLGTHQETLLLTKIY